MNLFFTWLSVDSLGLTNSIGIFHGYSLFSAPTSTGRHVKEVAKQEPKRKHIFDAIAVAVIAAPAKAAA